MPIKGLTDRGLSFPQIGSIKLGTKKTTQNGKEYPSDLKFFRVEFDTEEDAAIQQFKAAYGGLDVTEINVMFPFNDIDRVWDVWLEAYTASRLWARSDGETFQYLADPDGGDPIVVNGLDRNGNPMPCDPDQPVGKDNRGKPVYLKPTGRLKVVIPELVRGAYLVLRTGSYHNVINVSSQLAAVQETVGRIAGVPLVLRRRPKMISTPTTDGGRARREKWLVSIELSPVWMRERFGEFNLLDLPIGTNAAQLPAHANGDNEPFEDFDEYEEGDVIDVTPQPEYTTRLEVPEPPEPPTNGTNGSAEAIWSHQWILDDGLVDNVPYARNMVKLLDLADLEEEQQRERVALYQSWREYGLDPKPAAAQAIAGNPVYEEEPEEIEEPF